MIICFTLILENLILLLYFLFFADGNTDMNLRTLMLSDVEL